MYPYVSFFNRTIPSYGLCMAIGILLSCFIGISRATKRKMDINSLIMITASAVGCALLGAKFLYIAVSYEFPEFVHYVMQGNIDVLINSGQVFYGGLIGGILGALLGKRISHTTDTPSELCNIIVPVVPLGHAIGRIGCFLGGCCYGAPYNGVLAVRYPVAGVYISIFPVQLLEAFLNLIVFGILLFTGQKASSGYKLLYIYLVLYSIERFTLEFFRGDEIRGITQGFSTSQWISIGLLLTGVVLLLLASRQKKKHLLEVQIYDSL